MKYRNFVLSIAALALVVALVPGIALGAAETTAPEAPVQALDLQIDLTEAPVTSTATLEDALFKGPKPVGLCANNGCATTCRDDADCGVGGNCIYTACF
jgi:hypothetical protein